MTAARCLLTLLFAALAFFNAAAPALALERGMFGAWSAEVLGTRPLLVVMLHDPDATSADELAKYRNYYEDTIFGRGDPANAATRDRFQVSAAGYFHEVSAGKFAWRRSGLVGPLTVPLKGRPAGDIARIAIEAAAHDGGFEFAPFDANHDGRITPDELAVLVITNVPHWRKPEDLSATGRGVVVAGQNVTVATRVAVIGENDGFATLNRALFRLIAPQVVDLDGWPQKCFALNGGRSLMAAGNARDSAQIMHLDPWHKMMLGWIEPRVVAFGQPGSTKLAAQHVAPREDFKAPVLLFDPMRGPREFFLLEYRTHSALGFDQASVNSGLVVWQVALDKANRPFAIAADRPNCKGETLSVPSVFVRGAPNWQLGGNKAYAGGDGPFSLKWIDGADTGVHVTVERHEEFEWRIAIAWTAPDR